MSDTTNPPRCALCGAPAVTTAAQIPVCEFHHTAYAREAAQDLPASDRPVWRTLQNAAQRLSSIPYMHAPFYADKPDMLRDVIMSDTTTTTPAPPGYKVVTDAAGAFVGLRVDQTTYSPAALAALAGKLRQAEAERDRALATVAAHAADVAAARGLRERHTALLRVARQAWNLSNSLNEIDQPDTERVEALDQALLAAFPAVPQDHTNWWWVKEAIGVALDVAEPMPSDALVTTWETELRQMREREERAQQRAAEMYQDRQAHALAAERAINAVNTQAERMRYGVANLAALLADAIPELADAARFAPPTPARPLSPAEAKGRLRRWQETAAELIAGLNGTPFRWRAVDAQHALPIVAAMGLTLVSRTHAERLGYRLRRGVSPVGVRYFDAPISREAAVFLLEAQATKVESEAEDGSDHPG